MKLKKICFALAAMASVSLTVPSFTNHIYAATNSASVANSIEGYNYEIGDDGITITEYTGSSKEVTIPSKISGTKVISIGSKAFKDNTKLKSVVVSSGVKVINKSAFSGCENLESVSLGVNLETVKKNAFNGCDSLTNVTYGGTKKQWKDVVVAEGNTDLTGAKFTYSSSDDSSKSTVRVPKSKKDLTVEYTSKIPFNGKDTVELEDLGTINVTYKDKIYVVDDINVSMKLKKFQITSLENADEKMIKAVKSLTKGSNGYDFKIKKYTVNEDSDVCVKFNSKWKVKKVKIMLGDDYYTCDKDEYTFDSDDWKLTFKGDHFKGSYVVQDADIIKD